MFLRPVNQFGYNNYQNGLNREVDLVFNSDLIDNPLRQVSTAGSPESVERASCGVIPELLRSRQVSAILTAIVLVVPGGLFGLCWSERLGPDTPPPPPPPKRPYVVYVDVEPQQSKKGYISSELAVFASNGNDDGNVNTNINTA